MTRDRTWIAAAIVFAVGCGTAAAGGLPTSGTDVSCDPGMYISDESCVDLPPFSDAIAGDGNRGYRADSGEAGDAGASDSPFATDDGPDAAPTLPADLLAPCLVAGDVLHLTTTSFNGIPMTTTTTLDESSSTFLAGPPPPLNVVAAADGGPMVAVEVEQVVTGEAGTFVAIVPLPAVYEAYEAFPGFSIHVTEAGNSFSYATGLVDLDDVEVVAEDSATPRLHSLRLSFRLVDPGVQTVEGCLSYVEPSGTTGPDAAEPSEGSAD